MRAFVEGLSAFVGVGSGEYGWCLLLVGFVSVRDEAEDERGEEESEACPEW